MRADSCGQNILSHLCQSPGNASQQVDLQFQATELNYFALHKHPVKIYLIVS